MHIRFYLVDINISTDIQTEIMSAFMKLSNLQLGSFLYIICIDKLNEQIKIYILSDVYNATLSLEPLYPPM